MATLSNVKYILFGVQFNHSFKLLDDWGEIADNILKSQYFGSGFFTRISTQYTTERELTNPDTGNILSLSSSNLVFKYHIDEKKEFSKEFTTFGNRIYKELVENILSKKRLIVRRIGVVYACELEKKEIDKFAELYFKDTISGITDFKFAKKEPTIEGLVWQGTENYINKIFTVGTIEDIDAFRGVMYDFQLYYKPLQADIRSSCSVFLNQSLNCFRKDILDQK